MAGLPLSLNIVLRIASQTQTVSVCHVVCLQAVHMLAQYLIILCTCHILLKLNYVRNAIINIS